MGRRLVSSVFVIGALAMPLRAQVVRVQTVEAESRSAIAGALVTLLDETGRRVVQGLTSESGWIRLLAPAPGTYRLRADRIGHAGVVGEPLAVRDSLTVVLTMSADRVLLPEVTVAGESRCGRVAEGEVTARLWEEVRKGLSANQLTISAQATPLTVRQFRRYRTLRGVVRADSTFAEFTTRDSPFVAPTLQRCVSRDSSTRSTASSTSLPPTHKRCSRRHSSRITVFRSCATSGGSRI